MTAAAAASAAAAAPEPETAAPEPEPELTQLAGIEVAGLWREFLSWTRRSEIDPILSLTRLPCTDLDCAVRVRDVWKGRLHWVGTGEGGGSWWYWDGDVFRPDNAEQLAWARLGAVEPEIRRLVADQYQLAIEFLRGRVEDIAKDEMDAEVAKGVPEAEAEAVARKRTTDYETRLKKHKAFSDRLRSNAGQSALAAQMRERMGMAWRVFDEGVRWLAFRNGVVDLDRLRELARTKRGTGIGGQVVLADVLLEEHSPDRLITQIAGVDWNPEAGYALWEWALERSLPSRDLRRYYQRLIGGSLLGEPEKRLVNAMGPTNSGKSTTLSVIGEVWGGYAHSANVELFLKDEDSDDFELDKLRKIRLVTAAEPEKGGVWNQSLLKKLTGRDLVNTRALFTSEAASGGPWRPKFTMFIGSNHELRFHTDDRAMAQRLCPVRFPVEFLAAGEGREEVAEAVRAFPDLDGELRKRGELTGVAVWCMLGMLDWLNCDGSGGEPVEVTRARSDMAEKIDSAREWVRAMVEDGQLVVTGAAREDVRMQPWVSGPGAAGVTAVATKDCLPSGDAYAAYQVWCTDEQGIPERSQKRQKAFRESLADLYGTPFKSVTMRYPGLGMTEKWKPLTRMSWTDGL